MLSLLEPGEFVLERLKETIAEVGGNVFSAADLVGVEEKRQVAPALHVVLADYTPVDVVGGDVVWEEVWLVVAVVKNVARGERVSGQICDGRTILRSVLRALAGWRPAHGAPAFKPIKPPRPQTGDTHAYFPLAFKVRTATAGCAEEI